MPGKSSQRARNRARAFLASHLAAAWQVPFDPEQWLENAAWRLGYELFHKRFFWEAHEAWEPLWRASPPGSAERHLLRSLLQWSASGVQLTAGRLEAALRTAEKAHVAVAKLQAGGVTACLGVDVQSLATSMQRFIRALRKMPHVRRGQALITMRIPLRR